MNADVQRLAIAGKLEDAQALTFLDFAIEKESSELARIRLKWVREYLAKIIWRKDRDDAAS